MSNSRVASPDVPADAIDTPLGQAVLSFTAAMYVADNCLERCRDACNLGDFASANFAYGDRQLMLAQAALDKARVALQLVERECEQRYKPSEPLDGDGTLFGKEQTGPYREGR